jgi:rubrerythrin
MIDYVYEVRGTDDPIDGDKVKFRSKDEAMEYYEEKKPTCPNAAVYIVEYEFDDFEGADNATSIPEQKTVVQIAGPGVETITTEDGFPNTCDGDNPDCYDENGMFRLPKTDDGLDEDLVEELKDEDIPTEFEDQMDLLAADEDEAIDAYDKVIDKVEDEHVQGELKKIETEEQAHKDYLEKVKEDHTAEYTEPLEDEDAEDDDIETESFAEELFSALSDKRDERAFPDGKLEQEPPHEDVPVVKCKVTPAITHSEDEKPLVEAANRADEFYDVLENNAPAQMYVAREIVYSLVDDEYSAQKLAS